jgi:hypothetical protein
MPQARQHPDHAARQRAYRARQATARYTELQAKGLPPSSPLPTMPSRARWQALLAQARLALETARDEMQTYYDARSTTWQEGERAALLTDHLEVLEQVLADLADLPPL